MDHPSAIPGKGATIALTEITKENLRSVLALKTTLAQEQFVASNAVSIAQAYFDREIAWFRAIVADGTAVGFVMLEDKPDICRYTVWRFMIDQRYQGLGFGAQAIKLLMQHVRTRPGAVQLFLSCVPGEGTPGPFYEKLGFAYTGGVDEGELIMQQAL